MQLNHLFKPSLLSVLVSSCLFTPTYLWAADCPAETVCETVIKTDGDSSYTGDDILVSEGNGLEFQGGTENFGSLYLKNNITVTGQGANAIYVDGNSTFEGNLNIEQGKSVVSENGTAIKIDGDFVQSKPTSPNMGVYVKNGSLISGAENALDFSESSSSMRIDVNGSIKGNIIGNNVSGNKINFAYQGGAADASFDGSLISGLDTIENHGNLTIISQDSSIIWDTNYINKANASMNFSVADSTDLEQPILVVTGKTTFQADSSVKVSYTGSNVNNLLDEDIILLESQDGISGEENVTVGAGSGFDGALSFDVSPILEVDQSWVVAMPPDVNGGVTGNQLIARYAVNYEGGDEFVGQVAAGGATANEIVVANHTVNYALNSYNQTRSDESGELLALLVSPGTDAAASAQLADELTPDAEGSEVKAALLVVDKMRSQVDDRTNILRNESYLSTENDGWNGWANLLYGYGEQSDSSEIHGYALNTYGINVGIDRVFDKQRLLGVSFAYANSSSDINNTANSKELDSFQMMLYSGWFNEKYFIDGNINIGRNDHSSSRTVGASSNYGGNTEAEADYNSLQIGYQLMAGMKFDLDMVKIEPRLAYNYQWLRVDDYEETGSPASLRYDRQSYSVKHFGAGFTAFNTYQTSYGQLTPLLSVMAYKDMDETQVIQETAGLAMDSSNDRFVIQGDQVGGDILELKLNAHLKMANALSASSGLNYYQRGDYKEGSINFNVSKSF